MANFLYGEHEKSSAPRAIERERVAKMNDKLNQSGCTLNFLLLIFCLCTVLIALLASQMWLLGRLLPLMVGDHVPEDDDHWICYVDLLRIMCIATATEVTNDSVEMLTLSSLIK